jgi:hypothetical protein
MPTLAVDMRIAKKSHNMPTASVGMAPINSKLTKHLDAVKCLDRIRLLQEFFEFVVVDLDNLLLLGKGSL